MDKSDTIRIANAALRYYMGVSDPDSLSDIEWAMRWKELEFIRQEEAKCKQ